jgi:hypothetical protein
MLRCSTLTPSAPHQFPGKQGVLQQTPAIQLWLAQSLGPWQLEPFGCAKWGSFVQPPPIQT